jgi:hypothetical protein
VVTYAKIEALGIVMMLKERSKQQRIGTLAELAEMAELIAAFGSRFSDF